MIPLMILFLILIFTYIIQSSSVENLVLIFKTSSSFDVELFLISFGIILTGFIILNSMKFSRLLQQLSKIVNSQKKLKLTLKCGFIMSGTILIYLQLTNIENSLLCQDDKGFFASLLFLFLFVFLQILSVSVYLFLNTSKKAKELADENQLTI